jgi:hypothetical protein
MTWYSQHNLGRFENKEIEYFTLLDKDKQMTKHWYESRTLQLAVVQGLIGIIAAVFASNPELQSIGWIAVLKSMMDMYIRLTHTTE